MKCVPPPLPHTCSIFVYFALSFSAATRLWDSTRPLHSSRCRAATSFSLLLSGNVSCRKMKSSSRQLLGQKRAREPRYLPRLFLRIRALLFIILAFCSLLYSSVGVTLLILARFWVSEMLLLRIWERCMYIYPIKYFQSDIRHFFYSIKTQKHLLLILFFEISLGDW